MAWLTNLRDQQTSTFVFPAPRRARGRLGFCAVVCAATFLIAPNLLATTLDPSLFGTEVGLDTLLTDVVFELGNVAGTAALNGADEAFLELFDPSADRSARGDQSLTRTSLSIGVQDFSASAFTPMAYAELATGYTASGTASGVALPASINLEGDIFDVGSSASASVVFQAQDYDGNFLATVDITTSLSGDIVSAFSNSSPFFSGPWTGALNWPFTLPPGSNGIHMILWGFCDIGSAGDLCSMDFSHSATLEITPPPGGTVTLASGRTFPTVAAVPEPGVLQLLTWGVIALALVNRRSGLGGR